MIGRMVVRAADRVEGRIFCGSAGERCISAYGSNELSGEFPTLVSRFVPGW